MSSKVYKSVHKKLPSFLEPQPLQRVFGVVLQDIHLHQSVQSVHMQPKTSQKRAPRFCNVPRNVDQVSYCDAELNRQLGQEQIGLNNSTGTISSKLSSYIVRPALNKVMSTEVSRHEVQSSHRQMHPRLTTLFDNNRSNKNMI